MAATEKCYIRMMAVKIKETHDSTTNLIIHDHHVIKGSRILTLDKLPSTVFQNTVIQNLNFKISK